MRVLDTPGLLAGSIMRDVAALESNSSPARRKVRKRYTKLLRASDPVMVIDTALILIGEDGFRGLAYELVRNHRKAFRMLNAGFLEALGSGIDSWWTVDSFARELSGPAWLEELVEDALIEKWALSEDLWWRRAALVSTVALNVRSHGGYGDSARTLHVCSLLVEDHEDMVVKAMSWSLRELVCHDPVAVRKFLDDHRPQLAARVLREVRNKLETGLKNP